MPKSSKPGPRSALLDGAAMASQLTGHQRKNREKDITIALLTGPIKHDYRISPIFGLVKLD